MDIINTPYWVLEFLKVLCGYLLVGILWPRFVFAGHLRGKSLIYQFSFCVSAQIVLINTVVLGLGLLHILNAWTVRAVFYGVPLAVLWRRLHITEEKLEDTFRTITVVRSKLLLRRMGRAVFRRVKLLWRTVQAHPLDYFFLGAIVVYALVYFSWGTFQNTAYGFGDQYVHHSWIYGLMQGKIFLNGIYPAGMHCMLYAIHTLLGVKVYSLVLFFGCVQCVLFFGASYCLLRELFRWRFTPILVLVGFILLEANNTLTGISDSLTGLSHLQYTLPLEFALAPQMICVLYLIRYLRYGEKKVEKGKFAGCIAGDELLVFVLALAAMLASHFHAAIMAFCLCLIVSVFYLKRIFSRERFLPLVLAVLCGASIALAPMVAGFVSGIPMQASMNWALGIISGEPNVDRPDHQLEELEELNETLSGNEGGLAAVLEARMAFAVKVSRRAGLEVLGLGWDVSLLILAAVITAGSVVLGLAMLLPPFRRCWIHRAGLDRLWLGNYFLLVGLACIMTFIYILPYVGLPELVVATRLLSTTRMLFFAVAAIPLDLLFALLSLRLKAPVLSVLSALGLTLFCIWIAMGENYHGFLYCELTRYRAEVAVMNHIIQNYPKNKYTVVSPTDGLYHMIEYGWHEELVDFLTKVEGQRYFIPTEHVFIFIEKRPLEYAQNHLAQGPAFLGRPDDRDQFVVNGRACSVDPTISSYEISSEAAQVDLEEYRNPFDYYAYNRNVLESKLYAWCQQFAKLYPSEMRVYYEDEDFVCYYFRQEPNAPYDLAMDYLAMYYEK